MFGIRQDIAILTNAAGAFTGFTNVMEGEIRALIYTPDPTTPLASTATFTVTSEDTAQPIMTFAPGNQLAFQLYPQTAVHSVGAGAAIAGRSDWIALGGQERVKLVVASGGNTLKGTLTIITG